MVVFNTGCMKYDLHPYTAEEGENQYLSKFKRNNFEHGVRREMKISSSLVVCVGCIIILQTKSLGNIMFIFLLLQNRMLIFDFFYTSCNSIIIINRSLEKRCCTYLNFDKSFIKL